MKLIKVFLFYYLIPFYFIIDFKINLQWNLNKNKIIIKRIMKFLIKKKKKINRFEIMIHLVYNNIYLLNQQYIFVNKFMYM